MLWQPVLLVTLIHASTSGNLAGLTDWIMGMQQYATRSDPLPELQVNGYEDVLMMNAGQRQMPNEMTGQLPNEITATTTLDTSGLVAILAIIGAYLVVMLALSVAICCAEVIFMVLYGSMSASRRPFPSEGAPDYKTAKDFSIGCFDCFSECQYCMHGCCCGSCRFADTQKAAGVMDYYMVIFILIGVPSAAFTVITAIQTGIASATKTMVPLNWTVYVIMGVVQMWFRQKLRAKLDPSTEPFTDKGQAFLDCLAYSFCGCCLIIQEAREVDKASGASVACCCKLTYMEPVGGMQMAVGQPVAVNTGGMPGMPLQGVPMQAPTSS